jgi:Ca2+-binding EF-hand superfamily protein
MKKRVLTLAFLAFAGAVGSVGVATARPAKVFVEADTDKSGDVSLDEFIAVVKGSMATADTDGDGKLTVAEIAAVLGQPDAEAKATKFIARFDADRDGATTMVEIETRRQARFAELDNNKDGKLTPDEFPARKARKTDRVKKPS